MKQRLTSLFKNMDGIYWAVFIFLLSFAVIALFSAGSTLAYSKSNVLEPLLKQMMFLGVGVVAAFILQFVPTEIIRKLSYIGLAVSLVLVILTFTKWGVTHNGAKRWLRIGFEFQPSELAKLFLIIVSADLLSRFTNPKEELRYFLYVIGCSGVICGLIMVENLSTALLLGGVVFLIILISQVSIKYWLTTLVLVGTFLVAGYFYVENHYIKPKIEMKGVMDRAITWCKRVDKKLEQNKNPEAQFELTKDNYQSAIAKVAIARGGKSFLGVGPGNSLERDFLPLAYADYIFAIIVEESGLLGTILLIMLYLMVLFRACYASHKYPDKAASLIAMGLALMITCQALVSMMVAVGMGPVTGQPLPLISSGGTSAVVTSVYFGILMAVAREQNNIAEQIQQTKQDSFNDVPTILETEL